METPMTRSQISNNGLESMATEVILAIMKELPELVALDSLIRASPVAFRVFNNYGVEVVEAVLASGHIHTQTRIMIRITALIRSATLPISSLHEFQQRVTDGVIRRILRPFSYHLAPDRLQPHTPPDILLGILASYRHITNLSLDFMKILLERFRALKPRRPIDASTYLANVIAPNLLPEVPTETYSVQDAGPPRWDEEERAIRSFWRNQILYDLKKAAANGMIEWPREDVDELNSMTTLRLYQMRPAISSHRGAQSHSEYQELASIADYLCETRGIGTLLTDSRSLLTTDYLRETLGPPRTHSGDSRSLLTTDYFRKARGTSTPLNDSGSWLIPDYPPREVAREWPAPELIHEPPSYWRTYGRPRRPEIFTASAGCYLYADRIPSWVWPQMPFQPFRRLGIAFWCEQRMVDYGLMPTGEFGVDVMIYAYTWFKLLDGTDLSKVQRDETQVLHSRE